MRSVLLLSTALFSVSCLAQTALLVDTPAGLALEVIDGTLTDAQSQAVADGSAVVVRRDDGWRFEARTVSDARSRYDTEALGATTVSEPGSYRASMTFRGTLSETDPDLQVVARHPDVTRFSRTETSGETHVRIEFRAGSDLDEATERALVSLADRASQASTRRSSSSTTVSHSSR